jgi:hypothetical protein
MVPHVVPHEPEVPPPVDADHCSSLERCTSGEAVEREAAAAVQLGGVEAALEADAEPLLLSWLQRCSMKP